MSGVLSGLRVVDLSWGTCGPLVTMLMADHGADVTMIERPGGAPFEDAYGLAPVARRGKLSAVLDLKAKGDLETAQALMRGADIVVQSFAPGTAERLGIAYEQLAPANPGLIGCSITGYGRGTQDEQRPAFDALVAARLGAQWEARGWDGGSIRRIAGTDIDPASLPPIPESIRIGSGRLGPYFAAAPVASVCTAYLALLGVSAALKVREATGRGQLIETSMAQGLILYLAAGWQRPDHPDAPGYDMAVTDRRQTWGMLKAKDRWVNFWTSPADWAHVAGGGDTLKVPTKEELLARSEHAAAPTRNFKMPSIDERLESLAAVAPVLAKFTAEEWAKVAAASGVCLQPVRSPEEALVDPALLRDGAVAVIQDPEHGVVHQTGIVFRLRERPTQPKGPAPIPGANTEEVRAEARQQKAWPAAKAPSAAQTFKRGPLHGIRVIDIGLAVAGPWCAQMLGDLGADVIKVDPGRQAFWIPTHMSAIVNRTKRSLHLEMKGTEGYEIARKLADGADVVMHNMRLGVAERLAMDYETLKKTNPRLVYCHTRGFDDGPRSKLPGHDQAANSLGGAVYEEGGCGRGGRPYFSGLTGGDIGNGYLGAIAITLALFDRERTGRGQFVDTSILNASLFNNTRVMARPDGSGFPRPMLDGAQLGYSALYRLYEGKTGWLCIAVLSDAHWDALARVLPELTGDNRFSSAEARRRNDAGLAASLETAFKTNTARDWAARLQKAGVPAEVSDDEFSRHLFENQEYRARQWISRPEGHPKLGAIDMFGIGIEFSQTPIRPGGAPPVLGQNTREILLELGYSDGRIDSLIAAGVVRQA